MARTYKKPSIVSGLSIQDILNIDSREFNKLNLSDLRQLTGRLVSAGNKRLRTFEKAGESSPAVRYVYKSGGKFSTRGKDLNALRAEFVRAKGFLQSATGTRKGWKRVKRETIKGLAKHGVKVSERQFDSIWKIYEKLKEIDPSVANRGMKYTILRVVTDYMTDERTTVDEIIERMRNQLTNIYEEQAARDENTGVSSFFTID